MVDVDIVVVTYNSADEITGFLDSIPGALGSNSGRTAVVDNASADATVSTVEARGDCLVVRSENRGYGAGINAGVEALAGTGPILVANPDVHLEAGSVAALVAELADPRVGIVVPALLDDGGTVARSLRREPTVSRTLGAGDSRFPRLSEIVNEPEAYTHPHEIEWATGAVMLVSRECFLALGGFDESFFMYSEETDLCLRARDAGWSVRFTPAARARHVGGGSGRNPELYAMQVLNRVRLHRRRHTLVSSAALLALTALRESLHAATGNPDSRRALEALMVRSRRPRQLGWSSPLLARNSARPRIRSGS